MPERNEPTKTRPRQVKISLAAAILPHESRRPARSFTSDGHRQYDRSENAGKLVRRPSSCHLRPLIHDGKTHEQRGPVPAARHGRSWVRSHNSPHMLNQPPPTRSHPGTTGAPKRAIIDFRDPCNHASRAGFVTPAERIATIDNDGTLWCEQPAYFQAFFVFGRVNELVAKNPELKDKEPYRAILENNRADDGEFHRTRPGGPGCRDPQRSDDCRV